MRDRRLITILLPLGVALLALAAARRVRGRSAPGEPADEQAAERAQTEEAIGRLQAALDEIRGRLPDLDRQRSARRRRLLNQRLAALGEQAQALLKELRSSSMFSR